MRRPALNWLDYLLLAVVVIVGALYGEALWRDQRVPAEITYMVAETPIVRSGGTLTIAGEITKNRDCPVKISRVYVSALYGTVRDPRTYRNTVPKGITTFRLQIDIPPLQPGEWIYRSFGTYQCGSAYYSVKSPDVPFTVVARGEGL